MTENEQKIINKISDLSGDYKCYDNRINHEESLVLDRLLSEIQQYRAIGNVEEFKALKEKSVANETVENDAYLWSCKCPNCGKKIHRGSEERTFYCEQCGIQLHQRAFTEKELDEARFERQMDEYED